jgi:hypothetical protein
MIKRQATGAFDCGLRCGDKVYLPDDPTRIGRVDAIISGTVKVIWSDTGWIQYVPNVKDLVVHERIKEELPAWFSDRPATVVPSPRSKLQKALAEKKKD